MQQQVAIGEVEGTGADLTVSLGFKPDYVKIVSLETPANSGEFFAGLEDSSYISAFDGDEDSAAGFTIAGASSANVDGEGIAYLAIRTSV